MASAALLAASLLAAGSAASLAASWPTAGHDVRRTGQSRARGALEAPAAERVVIGGSLVNMPATISSAGILVVGTWGLVHDQGSESPLDWTKSDGKVHAFHADLSPAWPAPFAGDPVPYCYVHEGTPETCPDTPGATLSFYNGTVEGTAALSADESTLYVGRGDGKLYAVAMESGDADWVFRSYDPADREAPDGGGELIGAPLVGPDGAVYAVTAAAGSEETNAVYAVEPDGDERWRFPSSASTFPAVFFGAPALSPDGSRLYVAGAWGPALGGTPDPTILGSLLAFDLEAAGGTGEDRLLWAIELEFATFPIWATDLAVGHDGTLFVGGTLALLGWHGVVDAYRDLGDDAERLWTSPVALPASVVQGLALREIGGETVRLYVTTGGVYDELGQRYPAGGVLTALDPATGAALWPAPFDPSSAAGGGGHGTMTGLALGADGTIYTGVSGETSGGRVLAVREDGTLLWQLELEGLLEYAHPVLGPGGDLYVGDAGEIRRCYWDFLPVEQGLCPQADDPRVYRIPPLLFADGFESGGFGEWGP